jgi:hypothetical protein
VDVGAAAAVCTGASAVVCVGNKVVAVVIDDEDCAGPAGGIQPGGGSKALFGSAARTGADATGGGAATVSVGGAMAVVVTLLVLGGVGAALATWLEGVETGGVGNKVVAVVTDEVEVAGVGGADAEVVAAGGGAAAVATGAVCPGGTHPGGGSNALLGSTGRAGAVATCEAGVVSVDVATAVVCVDGAVGVGVAAVVPVTGAMGVAVTDAGGVAAAACDEGSDDAVGDEVVEEAGAGVPAAAASSALRSAT